MHANPELAIRSSGGCRPRYAEISIPQPTPAPPGVRVVSKPTRARTESGGSVRVKREDAGASENRLSDKQDFDPDVCECWCTSLSLEN